MTVEEIRSYLRLFDAGKWTHLRITDDGDFLHVSRAAPAPAAAEVTEPDVPAVAPAVLLTSPSVGVIRRPGSSPATGDLVPAGAQLAEIAIGDRTERLTSPVAGTVIRVAARDGAVVEYGDDLFEIQPR